MAPPLHNTLVEPVCGTSAVGEVIVTEEVCVQAFASVTVTI